MTRPRILMITEFWPYPGHSGAGQRSATTIEALASVGSVELFHIDRGWVTDLPWVDPPSGLVARWHRAPVAELGGWRQALRQARHPTLPRDLSDQVGRLGPELARWCDGRAYDLVWCAKETAWATVRGGVPPAPVVIDVDDLYEVTAARRHAMTRRAWPGRLLGRLDLAHLRWAWRRSHRRHATEAQALVLCSEVDRRRLAALGADNTVVVPNAYRGPALFPPERHAEPPGIILQAAFGYFPNLDAAHTLADHVLPAVRRRVPEARLYLVGYHGGRLDGLSRRPGVVVTGEVADMTPWLRRAHVCAVPIRAGSGTRTKILEAVAHGLAVVSSTIGIEGLELRHEAHAYVTDDPSRFAAYCVRLLEDARLRVRMVNAAQAVVSSRYLREHAVRAVVDTARSAMARFVAPTDAAPTAQLSDGKEKR